MTGYKVSIKKNSFPISQLQNIMGKCSIQNSNQGFPGGAVVRDLPANAGDTGSSPGLGRSHMPRSNWAREPQLLSPCATTTETCAPGAHAPQQEKPPQ